ncbi:hypothetical protein [Sporotomaculum syntrophicum]|uniref:hypothetical protein n=1 Tax=Sporotomaculum syntrophicum TaxID=182264 RepID=UPI00137B0E4E|nr:hypothetical protein [Sporotomaculum syntrophicum]
MEDAIVHILNMVIFMMEHQQFFYQNMTANIKSKLNNKKELKPKRAIGVFSPLDEYNPCKILDLKDLINHQKNSSFREEGIGKVLLNVLISLIICITLCNQAKSLNDPCAIQGSMKESC